MRNADVETAVGLVFEDRPLDLARLAARRPAALAGGWGDILLALAAADGIGAGALLDAVRGACPAAVETVVRHEGRGVLEHLNGYDCTAMHWACKHASLPGAAALHRLDPGLLDRPNRRGGLEWRELYQADLARRS